MSERIEEIVRTLPDLKNVNGVWETAERRLHDGDAAFLGELGIALVKRFGTDEKIPQYRSVFDHLLRLLAVTPGPGNVIQTLRLISAARSVGRKLDRYTASMLAANQSPADLAALFNGGGTSGGASEELRACLVHELVLRGVPVLELPGIARWATSPHWRRHPLRWLPLDLSPIEERRDLPSYGIRGSSHAVPYGPSTRQRGSAHVMSANFSGATETTTDAIAAAISTAVVNWTDESNGRIEARVFDLPEPVTAETVRIALRSLGLECLAGQKSTSSFTPSPCDPADAWRVLFAAASSGGAYSSGCFGAYGRLLAWQSLAGLCGASEGASAAEVAAHAEGCAWYGFDADSPWFEHVAWDIGLVALHPGLRRLAVLAATDTD